MVEEEPLPLDSVKTADEADKRDESVREDQTALVADLPALGFVLTNNFNLTAAQTKGVIETRKAFGGRKYYSDLFEECEDYLVVVSEGFGESLCERVTRESEESYPVLLELQYDFGKLRCPWRQLGDGFAVSVLRGCIPLTDVATIHFRYEHDLKEYETRAYSEFAHDPALYNVSPELFDGEGPDVGMVSDWLRSLPEAGPATPAEQVDRLAGAQCLVVWRASQRPVGGLDGPSLLEFIVGPYRAGTSVDVGVVTRTTQDLVLRLAGEGAIDDIESRLTEAAVKVLMMTDPGAKFRRRDVFKEVVESVDAVELPKKDKERWNKVEKSLTAVLRDEADRPKYVHGESLLSAHALLATLQNHNVEKHLKLKAEDVGSAEVLLVCAAFTGLLHGRAMLDASYRGGELDEWLALNHAKATTPKTSPLAIFDSFRDLDLQASSQRGWKDVILWRGRSIVELPVARPSIRDVLLGGSLASDVLEGALLRLAQRMGWTDVVWSDVQGRGNVTSLHWEEREFRAHIASAEEVGVVPGVDVESVKARLEESAELPAEVEDELLALLETELRPELSGGN